MSKTTEVRKSIACKTSNIRLFTDFRISFSIGFPPRLGFNSSLLIPVAINLICAIKIHIPVGCFSAIFVTQFAANFSSKIRNRAWKNFFLMHLQLDRLSACFEKTVQTEQNWTQIIALILYFFSASIPQSMWTGISIGKCNLWIQFDWRPAGITKKLLAVTWWSWTQWWRLQQASF